MLGNISTSGMEGEGPEKEAERGLRNPRTSTGLGQMSLHLGPQSLASDVQLPILPLAHPSEGCTGNVCMNIPRTGRP